MGAFLEKPKTEKETFTRSGNGLTAVGCHMQGWRVSMEDAAVLEPQVGPSKMGFFGVFDGHGGSFAAQYTSTQLVNQLVSHPAWDEQGMPPEALCDSLKGAAFKVDEMLAREPSVKSGEDRSGTTAVYGLVTPEAIVIANIGDSRSVMATKGQTIPMSFDHKPTNPGEQARIEAAGGSVTLSRVNGDLAVSRALGDFSYKQSNHLEAHAQQVSPEADCIVHERTAEDEFLVLACDGIWDVMSNEDVVAFFRTMLQTMSPEQACEKLLDECLEKKSRDNMTVVLVLLAQ
jgi:serine/threonine protein phosphatase PrpC